MHLYSIQNYLGLVWPAVDASLFSAIVLDYVIDTSYQTDSDEQCLSDPSDPESELTSGGFWVKRYLKDFSFSSVGLHFPSCENDCACE